MYIHLCVNLFEMPKKKVSTPNFDRINPASCINAKLRKLHRLLNQVYQMKIAPFGLKGSMLSILFIIGKKENISQKELADMLVLDQSTMSRDLKKLSERNWIGFRVAEDARLKHLFLTIEGYELLEQVSPIWERLHNKVESLLGDFNVKHVDVLIHALRSNIDDLKE